MKVSFKIDDNVMRAGEYYEDPNLIDALKLYNKELDLDENDGVPPPKSIVEDLEKEVLRNIRNKIMEKIAIDIDRSILLDQTSYTTKNELTFSYVYY